MIGILGASGSVGRHAAEFLADTGELRLGGRDPDRLPGLGERTSVDHTDQVSLAKFCAGLHVVVNCAGPSYEVKDRVARAALAAGADYVDLGGDAPAHEALTAADAVTGERRALLSAGTVPGLAVLLPRWLADESGGAGNAASLAVYAGGLETVSPAAASDILLSLSVGGANGEPFGHPLAAWRHGRRQLRALRAEEDAEVPYFPDRVALQPILTAELERLAARLRLAELDWYNVYPGAVARTVFNRLPMLAGQAGVSHDQIRDQMIEATAIDLVGRVPYYRMVAVLRSTVGTTTVALSACDSYRITAFVAAAAARAILLRRVPPGLHYAGEVLDPAEVVDGLASGGIADIAVHAGDPSSDELEEGSL